MTSVILSRHRSHGEPGRPHHSKLAADSRKIEILNWVNDEVGKGLIRSQVNEAFC